MGKQKQYFAVVDPKNRDKAICGSVDDFDENGYLIGHENEEEYAMANLQNEIVWFDNYKNADAACFRYENQD